MGSLGGEIVEKYRSVLERVRNSLSSDIGQQRKSVLSQMTL